MHGYDVVEIQRVKTIDAANEALAQGWKLLTVVTPIGSNGQSVTYYVLGWPAGTPGKPEKKAPVPFLGVGVVSPRR